MLCALEPGQLRKLHAEDSSAQGITSLDRCTNQNQRDAEKRKRGATEEKSVIFLLMVGSRDVGGWASHMAAYGWLGNQGLSLFSGEMPRPRTRDC